MGIAEQSGTGVAAGLAKEGKLPVFGTYGVFAAGRNLDQLRTTVCYGNFNVFIAGAHGGVSVGPDGATHQALEDLFQMCGLPNMNVVVPCDSIETKKATEFLLFEVKGPKGKLNDNELEFFETWTGQVTIARNVEDVLETIGVIYKTRSPLSDRVERRLWRITDKKRR